MPNYETPQPISVKLDLVVADIEVRAGDRRDTVVDVQPNSANEVDRKAAEQTTVEYADGRLSIKMAKQRKGLLRRLTRDDKDGGVRITIDLPAGSRVTGETGLGYLRGTGVLGECRFKTAAGDIDLDRTGPLNVETALGVVSVGKVVGHVELVNTQGQVRIREVDGTATIRNVNGTTTIGAITGALKFTGVNGDVSVDRAATDVEAKTANGNVRIGEVVRGTVVLETAAGSVEVGVREGTEAWLDAHTQVGSVRNELDDSNGPREANETVKVRARTSFGAIDIRRSSNN